MKRLLILATVAVLAIGAIGTASANDDQNQRRDVKATLSGYAEVPANSTAGKGKLRLRLDSTNTTTTTITYTLTFSGLEGTVLGANLRLGQAGVDGGIIANLCPVTCVSPVTGTITAANITALPAQGIAGPTALEFAEVLKAIRAGVVYVNVRTTAFIDGEIRGQLQGGKSGD
jgi:opacity protein-like surface antigen